VSSRLGYYRGFIMGKGDPAKLVKVQLKFLGISAEWEADPTERRAAWSLYVELITRICTQPLAEEQGLLREALASLYSIFQITRDILREAGPDVGASEDSVGGIAVAVLNRRLRPILTKWHPMLVDYESIREDDEGRQAHERDWPYYDELRHDLEHLRKDMDEYATALAEIAGVRH